MTVFFFILDTSGSMSTRSHPQFSFLDLAKNYIENFIKSRNRNDRMMAVRENDRYFLMLTQGRYPENLRVISEKNGPVVVEELKKIQQPFGTGFVHQTILDAFKVLHTNRTQTGIDGFGGGRFLAYSEQIVMIVLTDGNGISGVPIDFRLYFESHFLGSDYYKEAYRWDQKLYTVVFRIPSTPYRPTPSQLAIIDIDNPIIEKVCSATGGRSYSIVSVRQIQTSIDQILGLSSQHKVGVRFACLPTIHFTAGNITNDEVLRVKKKFDAITNKKPVTNLISRLNPQGRPVIGHWMIPENYFPVRNMDQLPQRSAQPIILCAPMALPLNIRPEIPVDKLELEPGGITEVITEILQGRKDLTVWTYMEGSSNGPTAPFGCLRMNTTGTGITLILLPFNFPLLYPLVEEVVKEPILTTSQVWRSKLDSYFQTVPFYFFTPLRNALEKIKVKVDHVSSMSAIYHASLLSHINRLKVKAKEDYDKLPIECQLSISKASRMLNPMIRIERITSRSTIIGLNKDDDDGEDKNLEDDEAPPIISGDFKIPLYPPPVSEAQLDNLYRNPYATTVEDIASKLNRIQANLEMVYNPNKATLLDMARMGSRARFNTLEESHNMPQKLMGEYEPYQQARLKHYGPPMRKINEEVDRTHAFGNPYKMKGMGAGIDEVMDSAVVDSNSPNQQQQQQSKRLGDPRQSTSSLSKRRRGPLSIDAFQQYRQARSDRSSNSSRASSVISDVIPMDEDSTSGTSTPSSEFDSMHIQEMDSVEQLFGNLDEVRAMREQEEEKEEHEIVEAMPPVPPAEILSDQELLMRKIQIGVIVRKPANHRAFDDIKTLSSGMIPETSGVLIRHALRESQRFKLKPLTEKLQELLRSIG